MVAAEDHAGNRASYNEACTAQSGGARRPQQRDIAAAARQSLRPLAPRPAAVRACARAYGGGRRGAEGRGEAGSRAEPGRAGPDAAGGAIRAGVDSTPLPSVPLGGCGRACAGRGCVTAVAVRLRSSRERGPSLLLRPSSGDGFPGIHTAAGRGDRGDQEGDGL